MHATSVECWRPALPVERSTRVRDPTAGPLRRLAGPAPPDGLQVGRQARGTLSSVAAPTTRGGRGGRSSSTAPLLHPGGTCAACAAPDGPPSARPAWPVPPRLRSTAPRLPLLHVAHVAPNERQKPRVPDPVDHPRTRLDGARLQAAIANPSRDGLSRYPNDLGYLFGGHPAISIHAYSCVEPAPMSRKPLVSDAQPEPWERSERVEDSDQTGVVSSGHAQTRGFRTERAGDPGLDGTPRHGGDHRHNGPQRRLR